MCKGCKQLTGFPLDVYAAALARPAALRMEFVEQMDRARGYKLRLVDTLGPMLAEHAND